MKSSQEYVDVSHSLYLNKGDSGISSKQSLHVRIEGKLTDCLWRSQIDMRRWFSKEEDPSEHMKKGGPHIRQNQRWEQSIWH